MVSPRFHVKFNAVKNLRIPVTDAEISQGDDRLRNQLETVRCSAPSKASHSYLSAHEKKTAVKTKSTITTMNIDITTALVVERPTCSAPLPVESPSRHPTAVIVMPNITLLINPDDDIPHKERVDRIPEYNAQT